METISAGDTAWVLVSTVLVMMMTPALAFFYGGMVRKKNILSTLNLSFIIMALLSLQWVLFGYTLVFGADWGGLIGGLDFLGFMGVGAEPNVDYAPTIPHLAFAAFQMMFAVITPALITGAFVERVRFKTFLLFSLLWATLVYDPVAHWVWGVGGILRQMGALDFAGGNVVHITAGYSALAFALVIGARSGFGKRQLFEPHHIPYSVLGAGLLWVGWFGFNAGSSLAANGVAVNALVTTNTAAAAAGLVWMLLSWRDNKPSVLGIVTGAVVGLVAIHAGGRVCDPLSCHGDRRGCGARSATTPSSCARSSTWMNRWMYGPATAWAAPGGRLPQGCSPRRRSTRRGRTACSSATRRSSWSSSLRRR
jgi:ammonium transporter, Amt family